MRERDLILPEELEEEDRIRVASVPLRDALEVKSQMPCMDGDSSSSWISCWRLSLLPHFFQLPERNLSIFSIRRSQSGPAYIPIP